MQNDDGRAGNGMIDFAVPDGSYLLSHSVGCLPTGSQAVLEARYYAPWRRLGGGAWPLWLGEIDRFRAAVALLVGGDIDSVCPQANVASGVAKILHALPERAGRDTLVFCEEDFPSPAYVLQQARRRGLRTRMLARGTGHRLESWADALGDDVQAALVTHAFSNRSARLPVAEITRLTRQRGVFSIVDTVQTAGVIPIAVADWSADFLVGGCVKFLCGGPGAGWLWAAPEALAVAQPLDVGWFSHAEPFGLDIADFRLSATALRFWGGTPSVAPFIQAGHAIETMLALGIERIMAHNQDLIDAIHAGLPTGALASAAARAARGNCVLVRVADPVLAGQRLAAARIHADIRDGCIRVSPHIYSGTADIDALLALVSAL